MTSHPNSVIGHRGAVPPLPARFPMPFLTTGARRHIKRVLTVQAKSPLVQCHFPSHLTATSLRSQQRQLLHPSSIARTQSSELFLEPLEV